MRKCITNFITNIMKTKENKCMSNQKININMLVIPLKNLSN